jgi:hypothetical protein
MEMSELPLSTGILRFSNHETQGPDEFYFFSGSKSEKVSDI